MFAFSRFAAAILGTTIITPPIAAAHAQSPRLSGDVSVQGNTLLRDGQQWVPHGFYQIAFESLPGLVDQKPFWMIAQQNYSPQEYVGMRVAGADSVRIQISQPGMDPQNALFKPQFRDSVIAAVHAARAAGLTVIISVQDEPQSGETTPTALPNAATQRVWQELGPVFGQDQGVLFELLNEPRLDPSAPNWQAWAQAMNATIGTVRALGAVNVVVADGLQFAEQLSGAPLLTDPLNQVVYASHPYSHQASDQTTTAWDEKFGNFAQTAPVIISEWAPSTTYYCDANTPASVMTFLQYLQSHKIGLEMGTWDWQPSQFGSAVYDFPRSKFSTFVGPFGRMLSCSDVGFGPGVMTETWYHTGTLPATIQ